MEVLIKDIVRRKANTKKEAKDRFNAILDTDISKTAGLNKYTKNQSKILYIFRLLKELFLGYETDDETDEKSDEQPDKQPDNETNETGDKQSDITDMPDLESEEYAEQGRKQKGQGLKILTPNMMLSRLPLTLLKARNNSEKLKNEIRQLFYLLFCSKKLSKTNYNYLINTI